MKSFVKLAVALVALATHATSHCQYFILIIANVSLFLFTLDVNNQLLT